MAKVDPYVIGGTNVLKNKLGITDSETLFKYEDKFVSKREFSLLLNPISGDLDFQHLKDIHKHLFQDVYEWAGKVRTVDIHKADRFAHIAFIEPYSNQIFSELKKEHHLKGLNKPDFIE